MLYFSFINLLVSFIKNNRIGQIINIVLFIINSCHSHK